MVTTSQAKVLHMQYLISYNCICCIAVTTQICSLLYMYYQECTLSNVDRACILAPIYNTCNDPADDPPWTEAEDDEVEEVVGRITHLHCMHLMSKG